MSNAIQTFFGWPGGGVWGNELASILWLLPVLVIAWWKGMCRVPFCPFRGQHPVKGTTWKVCHRHHQPEHHEALFRKHLEKHPERLGYGESHKLLH